MATIFVDVDDTVADMLPAWLDRYNKDYDDHLTPEDIKGWKISDYVKCGTEIYKYLDDPALYDHVSPVPYALGGVDYLRGAIGHHVVFATSTPNLSAGRKLRWLVEHDFLSSPKTAPWMVSKDYIEVYDKSLLRGDVLIDDGPHNVQGFKGLAILMRRPHNADFEWPLVANSWDDVCKLFDEWGENIPLGTHPTELKRPQQARGFRDTVDKMYQVHLDKNADYSPANILGVGEIGLVTRIWDKVARILNLTGFRMEISDSKFEAPKQPKNESLDDSWLDLSVYSIIAQLYRKGVWGK